MRISIYVPPDLFEAMQQRKDLNWSALAQDVDVETAVNAAKRLTESLGARMGTTRRVIIVDGGDITCFEWRHGKGVVFPQREVV